MRPEPAFEAPWHAQVFALTVHLHDLGHFTWPDWADRFGATLSAHGAAKDLNGGDDYFVAWVETLENLLHEMGLAEQSLAKALKAQWETAYLSTPHGQPVSLSR